MSAYRDANSTAPAHGAYAVVPSDSTFIPVTRALYVGVSGDLAVRMADDMTITFKNVPVGILSIQVEQVLATGTTADELISLY